METPLQIRALLISTVLLFTACSPSERPEFLKEKLPINVSARPGLSGSVVYFTNESNRTLVIKVAIANNAKMVKVSPGETAELSWYNGFTIKSGDAMVVSHADYKQITYTIR